MRIANSYAQAAQAGSDDENELSDSELGSVDAFLDAAEFDEEEAAEHKRQTGLDDNNEEDSEDLSQDPYRVALRHKILSPEEEVAFLKKIAKGTKTAKIDENGLALDESGMEVDASIWKIDTDSVEVCEDGKKTGTIRNAEARKAIDDLASFNYRLVVRIAKKRRNQGLDKEDLFAEGVLGLIAAIKKFDLNKKK